MTEQTVRAILRLIAVAAILVGAILTTATMVSFLAVRAIQGVNVQVTGTVAQMGFYAVLAQLVTVAWGVVLYFWSPLLARRVVE